VRFLGKRGAIESFGVRQLTLTMTEQSSLNVRIHEDSVSRLVRGSQGRKACRYNNPRESNSFLDLEAALRHSGRKPELSKT
jgi:hypothetical protein